MDLLDVVKEMIINGECVFSHLYEADLQRDILITQDNNGDVAFWLVTDGDPEDAINFLVKDVQGDWVEKQEDTPTEYLYCSFRSGYTTVEQDYMLVKEGELIKLVEMYS